jgi:S-adenosyl-L-methionine hydrolase (adenosine-forming)
MIIALLTDFGTRNWYPAAMKAVIRELGSRYGCYPEIIDISHEIRSCSITEAAFTLYSCYRYFPSGTVFCAVVDPGVGSSRKIIACASGRYFFIAPDNGLLFYVAGEEKMLEMVYVKEKKYFLEHVSTTFQGRDIFAPCAFHMSRMRSVSGMGPAVDPKEMERGAVPVFITGAKGRSSAEILMADKFGNLITNVSNRLSSRIKFLHNKKTLPCRSHYAEAKRGELFVTEGSSGFLEIICREGSAAEKLKKHPGDTIGFTVVP